LKSKKPKRAVSSFPYSSDDSDWCTIVYVS
jgi:hypothetical protein